MARNRPLAVDMPLLARRLRRRNDAANAAELMIEFSLASENYELKCFSPIHSSTGFID